jgi:hypothetical protein
MAGALRTTTDCHWILRMTQLTQLPGCMPKTAGKALLHYTSSLLAAATAGCIPPGEQVHQPCCAALWDAVHPAGVVGLASLHSRLYPTRPLRSIDPRCAVIRSPAHQLHHHRDVISAFKATSVQSHRACPPVLPVIVMLTPSLYQATRFELCRGPVECPDSQPPIRKCTASEGSG